MCPSSTSATTPSQHLYCSIIKTILVHILTSYNSVCPSSTSATTPSQHLYCSIIKTILVHILTPSHATLGCPLRHWREQSALLRLPLHRLGERTHGARLAKSGATPAGTKGGGIGDSAGGSLEHPRRWRGARWATPAPPPSLRLSSHPELLVAHCTGAGTELQHSQWGRRTTYGRATPRSGALLCELHEESVGVAPCAEYGTPLLSTAHRS